MDKEKLKGIIESILFTMGDLVEPSRIAAALELPEKEVTSVLTELAQEYIYRYIDKEEELEPAA